MPSPVAVFAAAVTAVNRAAFNLAVVLVFVIVPIMLIEVTMRYLFNSPTVWGMELATLLFGPYFLLGGPYVLHLRGHVAMDLLYQRLSLRARRTVDLVNLPIIMAFCLILLWYTVPVTLDSFMYGETSFSAWNPPIWWTKAAVPIALFLLLAQALAEFLMTLTGGVEAAPMDAGL
ncbi:TRAP transporter small permease subunit [Microvirga roseola]|uniref:TRAP transporter small permease subunit n=1 Tax=Microvirga roseola TaxID=2883126 RepID=UPI001E2A7826|nr:TRAP transporter small permease subunit [Microvirga roseola]